MKKVLFLFMACLFVTIHAQAQVPVTGVDLDETTLSLVVGEDSSLVAIIMPADADIKTVIFTSSDSAVVDIIAIQQDTICQIKALSAGTATITVTTDDGGYTATCNITVTEPVTTVSVTGVQLSSNSIDIFEGKTQQLAATVLPDTATNKNVTWSSEDPTIATVSSSGLVTAVKAGTTNIIVTTVDGAKTDTCAVTVDIDTSNEIVEGGNARVYIANNRIYIQSAEAETIHIYGINGSLVYTNNKPEGEASFDINTQESILIVKGNSGWVKKVAK